MGSVVGRGPGSYRGDGARARLPRLLSGRPLTIRRGVVSILPFHQPCSRLSATLLSATLLSATLLCATLSAKVASCDIGATGFSTNVFGVIGAGATVTGYATPGFQGTGPATSQAILWDPAHPNDFIVGGFGFVGRATITGPGAVAYALITNNVGIVSQMSWDGSGGIVIADSGGQVRRLDPATGAVVDLSAGAQPWGTSLNAGAIDRASGDVVVGGNGALYRLANGSATGATIVGGLGGFVTGVAFDPVTGEIVATVLTVNRLIRVDRGGTVTDVAPPGSLPGPNAFTLTPGFAGQRFCGVQHACFEPVPGSLSWSNGLVVEVR